MDPVNLHSIIRHPSPVGLTSDDPEAEAPPFFVIERFFPRIATAIELMWGNRELDDYLRKLIVVERSDRAGFPRQVIAALLKLHDQHATRFKFQKPEDQWAQEYRINRVKNRP